MYSDHDTHRWVGCPIRISTDQSLLAAPHGFSQRATSFIASWCQGIHRMPLSRSIAPHAQKPATAHAMNQCPCKARPSEPATLRSIYTHASDRIPPRIKQQIRRKASPTGSDQPASRCKPETHQPLHLSKEHLDTRPHETTPTHPRLVPFPWNPIGKSPVIMPQPLVEADGIEPTTPCLQSRCSPN